MLVDCHFPSTKFWDKFAEQLELHLNWHWMLAVLPFADFQGPSNEVVEYKLRSVSNRSKAEKSSYEKQVLLVLCVTSAKMAGNRKAST